MKIKVYTKGQSAGKPPQNETELIHQALIPQLGKEAWDTSGRMSCSRRTGAGYGNEKKEGRRLQGYRKAKYGGTPEKRSHREIVERKLIWH